MDSANTKRPGPADGEPGNPAPSVSSSSSSGPDLRPETIPTMSRFEHDQLKYPSRDGTYLSQLYNQPIVTTLTSFSQVANLVRNPYELINNVDEFVRHASGNKQGPKSNRNTDDMARVLKQNSHSLTPSKNPVLQEMDAFAAHNRDQPNTATPVDSGNGITSQQQAPIPVIPPIEASNKRGRLEPLTIEEYETKYRQTATDLELIERIFAGSMACNQLRAALWPYLFGLILHRGKFDKFFGPNGEVVYMFVEHEANNSRWRELKNLYEVYHGQWKAILPDQELRFSTFRERKSLIERDVIRCDRLHPFYAEEPQNLSKITSLLMSYMMYDFDIGYVQGMSDIAGPILFMFNGDLVKSFWVFVEVMKLFRRNFELTQKTIHFQLGCLYELVKNTDPIFAQYLDENDSSNCFFAFRAIVCQFKRELMKEDEDDYSNVLFLWDTIWCVARRRALQEEMDRLTKDIDMNDCNKANSSQSTAITAQPTQSFDNPFVLSVDPNQADSLRHELTETEIFVLALCLSMIRRERDIIMANKLDGTDIHLHFINPKLSMDLNSFIEHAINIYSYLKNDFELTKIVSPPRQSTQQPPPEQPESYAETSPASADDSLSDFLIINAASGS